MNLVEPMEKAPKKGIHRAFGNRLFVTGAGILIFVILVSFIVPMFLSHDPAKTDIRNRLQPPGGENLMGTDDFGRDILVRVLYGAQISLFVAFTTTLIVLVIGVSIGLLSGYYGRYIDDLIMRVTDVFLSFPELLLALGIMAVMGRSLPNLILALVLVYTPRLIRLVRGTVLSLKTAEYVESCHAMGMSSIRIMFRHLLPNAFAPILVQTTVTFAYIIRYEAALSFLGLGVPPPTPTWGGMLADGNSFMVMAPWMAVFPGIMLAITILAVNSLGDGLRDVADPRTRAEK